MGCKNIYPFWGIAAERLYEIGVGNPPIERGEILRIAGACEELGKFLVVHESSGQGFCAPYASITPLCQICEEGEAAGRLAKHPSIMLCAACLELAALLEELGEEVDMNDR